MLTALPSRTLAAALLAGALLVVTPATAVVATTADEPATAADDPTTELATATGSTVDASPCEDDGYEPPALDRGWGPAFVDSLGTASRADWTGGRVVRVGATGDCSLAVLDDETATLTATTVDGTRGVLTGTLDLGANGRLALVPAKESTPSGASTDASPVTETRSSASTATGAPGPATTSAAASTATTAVTATGAPTAVSTASGPATSNRSVALALSKDGPDFASSVLVTAGDRSTRVTLPTGRFFHFAVRRADGTTRVALWDVDERWDRQWDVRVASATESADWRVRLRGRAFLDGVAVGVGEGPGPGETAAPGETPVRDDSDDDPFPNDGFDPDEYPSDDDTGGSGSGQAFWGVCLAVFGVVSFRYARGITRFGEQMDAIGSKTRMSEVEAADWNVALTKIVGAVLVVVGVGMLVGAVL